MTLQSTHQIATGPSKALSEEDVASADSLFRKHGALLLPESFDRESIRDLGTYFEEHYLDRSEAEREKSCLRVGKDRYMFTVRIDGPFADPSIYASPVVLPIVTRILGDDAILQSFGAVCAHPGAPMQHVHQDYPELFPSLPGLSMMLPAYALHVVIPLIDLDKDTGTTALWEGSHRAQHGDALRTNSRDAGSDLELDGAVKAYARMGDCYLMDFRLRHAGTPNLSDDARTILYLVYSRPWFSDRVNFEIQEPLVMKPTDFDAVAPEHKHLFSAARPATPPS